MLNGKKRVIITCIILVLALVGILQNQVVNANNRQEQDNARNTQLKVDENGELQINRNHVSNNPMGKEGTWTVFVYMCGSDLERNYRAATRDIKEMIAASQCENVNIIIQTGGADFWNKPCIDADKIGRYVIKNNRMELVESHPNANMGDGKTLKSFLNWGLKKYPAEHMGVILWNHGGGVVGGICSDINNDGDSISLLEMEKAFFDVSANMTDKFEFVGFDACIMSTIEVANILVPYADYMIASEQPESSYGWEYKALVNALVYNPNIETIELGKEIINSFSQVASCNSDNDATLSMIDLSKVDDVLVEFNKVAKNMNEKCVSGKVMLNYITSAWSSSSKGAGFWQYGLMDMYDYLEIISELGNDTDSLKKTLENMIVYETHGTEVPNAHGINIYFPFVDLGMPNMNMLRNVIISPYYMDFIDKVICYNKFRQDDLKNQGYINNDGTTNEEKDINDYIESEYGFENYKNNNWENSDYYYENDYEFIEYNFNTIDEYLDLREFPYFENASFDDNWYELYQK